LFKMADDESAERGDERCAQRADVAA